MDLHFYFDIVCPFAYLASTRVERVAQDTDAALHWEPVLLGGLFNHISAPQNLNATRSANRQSIGARDLHRRAQVLQAPFATPHAHPQRTVSAMRLVTATPPTLRPQVTNALYSAYWVDGKDMNDRALIDDVARRFDMNPDTIDAQETKDALRAKTAEAAGYGMFGVPTFRVRDEIWWGVDRLHFVRQALGGAPTQQPPPSPPRTDRAKLTFFHDFSSPFSYLASTQIQRIADEHEADLEWSPILLGALFNAIGTENVPLFSMSDAKRQHLGKDMQDWARWWGVPLHFPKAFPLRTVSPLRVALQAPSTTPALYRAAWVEDRDIGDPDVLQGVLNDAGFDGPALLAGCQDPTIKAKLRANTEAAMNAGACGVPTFLVNDQHLFWGQDRLDQVAAALDGWLPTE